VTRGSRGLLGTGRLGHRRSKLTWCSDRGQTVPRAATPPTRYVRKATGPRLLRTAVVAAP